MKKVNDGNTNLKHEKIKIDIDKLETNKNSNSMNNENNNLSEEALIISNKETKAEEGN